MPFQNNIFAKKVQEQKEKVRAACRPGILKVVDAEGEISLQQYQELEPMNSFEKHLLLNKASKELLVWYIKAMLPFCRYNQYDPEGQIGSVYDEVVLGLLVPKLLKKIENESSVK